jgi:ABC-type transport system substrate-binding protein
MPVVAVWPVGYLRKVGAQAFENRPVGTGPYMVARWVHGEYIDLVRSPDYWDQERAGHVDAVHLPIVSEPQTDDIGEGQWQLFQKSELDMAAVTLERFAALRGDEKAESGEWQVKAWPNLVLQYVGVNMTSPRVGGDENLPLRQALNYAVDQRAVVDPVMKGAWLLPTGILPPGILGAGQAGLPYAYDPEKARELVAGMRTTPSVDLWCISGHGYEKIAGAVKAAWERAGIQVKLTVEQYPSFYAGLAEGKADLFIHGWIADYPAAETVLSALFHSRTSGFWSYTFYSDPETDRLLDLARGTSDDVRRAQLYSEAEATILEDAPLVPLYVGTEPRVTVASVQGQAVTPMIWTDMWKVWVKAKE